MGRVGGVIGRVGKVKVREGLEVGMSWRRDG